MTMTPTPPVAAGPPAVPWYKQRWFIVGAPILIGMAFRVACPLITSPEGKEVCEVCQRAWETSGKSLFSNPDGGL